MFKRNKEFSGLPIKQVAFAMVLGVSAISISSVFPIMTQPAWAETGTGNAQQGKSDSGNSGSQADQGNQGGQDQGQGGPSADF